MMSAPPRLPHWQLRRTDQVRVAIFVVLALAAVLGWWASHDGWQGGLVEIDQAEPLAARFTVDVNAADQTEWMQIPGVGPRLAEQILESRKSAGPFHSHDDLLRVHGIGKKTLARIRPYLRAISDGSPAAD